MIRFWLAFALALGSATAFADPFRVATFNASLSRKGPGLLLRDILRGKDRQIAKVARIIKTVRPDVLLINELDHDYENRALFAFLKVLNQPDQGLAGINYPYFYAPPQNTGVPSGLDLNGDGKLGGPADAFGFGFFRGQYAMALVSRFPIDQAMARDFSKVLWKQVPGGEMPTSVDGSAFLSIKALHVMRLSSKGHWDVPVRLPDGRVIHVLASHPTPPVFDGPEDMNGKRNRDEILFWTSYIKQTLDVKKDTYIVVGDLNSDPFDGDGNHQAIRQLIADGRLSDPEPRSIGGVVAAKTQGGVNGSHRGNPALDTADWREVGGPGNLRVDYVLPSQTLKALDAGVFWPAPSEAGFALIGSNGRASSDHRLVWVDLE